jgi:phage gp29-like protein
MGFLDRFKRNRLSIETEPVLVAPPTDRSPLARTFDIFNNQVQLEAHPGHSLTARKLNEIFQTAETGWQTPQADLFNDSIEQDAHLQSQLFARQRAVLSRPWILLPGGDAPAEIEGTKRLKTAMSRTNWLDFFAHQLKAQWFGFSASEIAWNVVDGWIVPTWFYQVPHRRFRFGTSLQPAGEEIRFILNPANTADGIALEPGVWAVTRALGDKTVRSGVLRACQWPSLFKRMSVRDWVLFAERFGIPYVTGTYDGMTSEKDKAVLRQAVMSLGKDGAAIFNKAMEITIHEVSRGGKSDDVHGAIAHYMDTAISKVVRSSTLLSETQGPGSYALGKVQQDNSFDVTLFDEVQLAQTFYRDIARPFFAYNGVMGEPANLKIHVQPEMDPATRVAVFDIIVNKLGVKIAVDQVRTEFQLQEPTGDVTPGAPQPTGPVSGEPAVPKEKI